MDNDYYCLLKELPSDNTIIITTWPQHLYPVDQTLKYGVNLLRVPVSSVLRQNLHAILTAACKRVFL